MATAVTQPVLSLIFHASSTLLTPAGSPEACAHALIRRLAWGSIRTSLLLEAEAAADAAQQQSALEALDLPDGVASVAAQPGTAALSLRMLVQQTGLPEAATGVVVGAAQLQRVAAWCPPACQLITLRNAAPQLPPASQPQPLPPLPLQAGPAAAAHSAAAHSAASLGSIQDILRHVVASHTADGTSFVIAYVMKASRGLALAQRGFFQLVPTDGLCFLPLDLERDLEEQGPFHAILHKASDELRLGVDGKPHFSPAFQKLVAFQARRPHMALIDPLANVQKVLDRAALLAMLGGLAALAAPGAAPGLLRPPAHVTVEQPSQWADVQPRMATVGMAAPAIVKPSVACGVAQAHDMTLVLRPAGFADVASPLPACVQEYVDHGAALHKIYVIGSEVHVVEKPSLPDLHTLSEQQLSSLPAAVAFDSLAGALPPQLRAATAATAAGADRKRLNRQLVDCAAAWLRTQLGLRLFGFDVVVQQTTGDHVVVDVNYFPSFKEVSAGSTKVRIAILQALAEFAGGVA